MNEAVALVDMDGVLCDYDKAMADAMWEIASPYDKLNSLGKINIWSDAPHIKARRDIISRQIGWWRDLQPLPLGFQILRILKEELGFDIHILTKGPASKYHAWTEKIQWCNEHLRGYDASVTITQDKGLVYGKVLVDDYPGYIKRWLEWRPRGTVIMPQRPGYNDDYTHPNVISCNRTNLDEVRKVLMRARDR
jgi:5'-nucleotidase